MNYDVIIVGAGSAGVSAAIYAKSRGLNVLLLEKKENIGGIIAGVSSVTHYASVEGGETGEIFAKKMLDQLERAGVKPQYENVVSVNLTEEVKEITTDKNTYKAKAVILANGCTPRKIEAKGANEHYGKTVGLNAFKTGLSNKGKDMYVIGGADGAVKEAIYLSQFGKTVTIVCIEKTLACISEFKEKIAKIDNIKVRAHSTLAEIHGSDKIEKLVFEDLGNGEKEEISCEDAAIYVYVGLLPNTEMYQNLELEDAYIKVNAKQETSLKGVYAAGDICAKQVRQVATAVSDGAIAGINASAYILAKK